MELFNRQVELLIGLSKGNEALKITNLKIEFDITKGADNEDNTSTAKIKIYNCNLSTRNQLLTIGKHIVVKAGYKGINSGRSPLVLFNGFVSKAFVEKVKPDTVVNIEAVDGVENIVNTSFSYYTKMKTSFYDQGYAYFGMAKDCLKEVLGRVGLTYSIQNEILYVHFPQTAIQTLGFVIKPSTGLLSIPQQLFEEEKNKEETDNPKWKLKCLLYPQLVPNSICRIESSTLSGEVLISEAHFQGSNLDGDFSVELTVIQL